MAFTWNDLEKLLTTFSEEQKKTKVVLMHEDNDLFIEVAGLETLGRDIYQHKEDEEDAGDLDELKFAHGEEFNINDYELVTLANRLILIDEWNAGIKE